MIPYTYPQPRVNENIYTPAETDAGISFEMSREFCYPLTGVRLIPTIRGQRHGQRYAVEVYHVDGTRKWVSPRTYLRRLAHTQALELRHDCGVLQSIGVFPYITHNAGDRVRVKDQPGTWGVYAGKFGTVANVHRSGLVTVVLDEQDAERRFRPHNLQNLGGVLFSVQDAAGALILKHVSGIVAAAYLQERIPPDASGITPEQVRDEANGYMVQVYDHDLKKRALLPGLAFLREYTQFSYPIHGRARIAADATEFLPQQFGLQCRILAHVGNERMRVGLEPTPESWDEPITRIVHHDSLIPLRLSDQNGHLLRFGVGFGSNTSIFYLQKAHPLPHNVRKWLTYSEAYEWDSVTNNLEDFSDE